MRASIAIISALAATVAATNVYTTVDLTITSCPPEITSCPGQSYGHAQTVYSTIDVAITSVVEEVSSCPDTPTSTSSAAYGTPYLSSTYIAGSSTVDQVKPPASTYVSIVPSPPAYQSSAYTSTYQVETTTTVAPYLTSIVTLSTSSKAPVASGTIVPRPSANGTTTSPPIASFTGAASSLSVSYGAFAGLAAIAALVMA